MTRNAPWLVVIFALAVGCASFEAKPLLPEATLASFESHSLKNPDLRKFIEANLHHGINPWPPKSWDLPLLTLAAFYYHPDLDVARARWQVADAGIVTAGARPNPSLGVTPQFVTNASSGVSPWIFTLSLGIPIETAGKRGDRIRRAEHLSRAAFWNMATAAWTVRSRVRKSLLELYTFHQKETLLRKQVKIQEEIVQLLQKRLHYGQISRPVWTQAQIALDQNRLSYGEAQKQAATSHLRLAEAMGLPPEALKEIKISFDLLEKLPAALPSREMQRRALLNRADILSALADYEAAQAALQLEVAKQYPDIRLGPGYEFDQGENKWALGFYISLPILNRNQGPIAQAEARRKESAAKFMALQAKAVGEVSLSLAGYSAGLRNLKTAQSLYAAQETEEKSVQALFDAGQMDRLALLSAQKILVSTALARLEAFAQAQSDLATLEESMQYPADAFIASLAAPNGPGAQSVGGK
jgi:cobalt-zinc-cadmium efflux system outer membrane protein